MKGAILTILAILMISSNAYATEMTWGFKNPRFSGQGYSSHVLSTEQLQHNRKEDIKAKAEAEQRRIERELENSTLNKFLKNVESRIYAQISKQMVDAMFADCSDSCSNTGTAEIEGSTITWVKADGMITLTIVGEDGTITELSIPASGDFSF
jgi:hypothetical protein